MNNEINAEIKKEINGVIIIDKPQNMTSHDVVAILRRKLKTKKIGHTGTLDPMATGVLPICIGKATKIVDFLIEMPKAYFCEMVLGSSTDTQDQWGEVIHEVKDFEIAPDVIVGVVKSFIGEIDQIPPMYSALKVDGQKLVDLARKGIIIERESRKRTVLAIENIAVRQHTISFDVICSKGTYIRTLCNDIGEKLGVYGHMTSLRRTMSDPFKIQDAYLLEDISLESIDAQIKSVETALGFMKSVTVPDLPKYHKLLQNGVKVHLNPFLEEKDSLKQDQFYKIYIGETFYGIAENTDKGLLMKKLF